MKLTQNLTDTYDLIRAKSFQFRNPELRTDSWLQTYEALGYEREIIGGLFDSFAARWINPEAPLPYPSGLRLM